LCHVKRILFLFRVCLIADFAFMGVTVDIRDSLFVHRVSNT
jgi:hypothetical protein